VKKGNKSLWNFIGLVQAFMMRIFVYRRRTCFYSATKGKIGVLRLRRKGLQFAMWKKLFFTVVKPLFSNDANLTK
jgi:hypothetical protein